MGLVWFILFIDSLTLKLWSSCLSLQRAEGERHVQLYLAYLKILWMLLFIYYLGFQDDLWLCSSDWLPVYDFFSCLSIPSAGITGAYYTAWLFVIILSPNLNLNRSCCALFSLYCKLGVRVSYLSPRSEHACPPFPYSILAPAYLLLWHMFSSVTMTHYDNWNSDMFPLSRTNTKNTPYGQETNRLHKAREMAQWPRADCSSRGLSSSTNTHMAAHNGL